MCARIIMAPMADQPAVEDAAPRATLARYANPLLRLVFRAPLKRSLGRQLARLRFTGRRSGRTSACSTARSTPSDREVGATLWGPPATANRLPAGIGRCCSVRSSLDQWSVKAERDIVEIEGAAHSFEGQPDLLDRALDALTTWVERV